jgi:hypothetical protein
VIVSVSSDRRRYPFPRRACRCRHRRQSVGRHRPYAYSQSRAALSDHRPTRVFPCARRWRARCFRTPTHSDAVDNQGRRLDAARRFEIVGPGKAQFLDVRVIGLGKFAAARFGIVEANRRPAFATQFVVADIAAGDLGGRTEVGLCSQVTGYQTALATKLRSNASTLDPACAFPQVRAKPVCGHYFFCVIDQSAAHLGRQHTVRQFPAPCLTAQHSPCVLPSITRARHGHRIVPCQLARIAQCAWGCGVAQERGA